MVIMTNNNCFFNRRFEKLWENLQISIARKFNILKISFLLVKLNANSLSAKEELKNLEISLNKINMIVVITSQTL